MLKKPLSLFFFFIFTKKYMIKIYIVAIVITCECERETASSNLRLCHEIVLLMEKRTGEARAIQENSLKVKKECRGE